MEFLIFKIMKNRNFALFFAGAFGMALFSLPALSQEFRSIDGTGNNLTNTDLGSTGMELERKAAANYVDGIGAVDSSRPNAREISNAVFSQPSSVTDARGLSEWNWVWGQFIDHDINHTLTDSGAGSLGITVATNDPYFGDLSPNNTINVTRSEFSATSGTGIGDPRQQVNNITPWMDGSNVYGGRATDGPGGVDRAAWLRTNDGSGKMKVSDGGAFGDLLPQYVHGTSPVMANTAMPGMTVTTNGDQAFVAGDVRANEHTALLATQTIFVREHNRLADLIKLENPAFTDEEIYQRARKIVGAEIQSITYNEYLPSLGLTLNPYSGYNSSASPGIAAEFSGAAFRLGHSQINGTMLRLNADGSVITEGNLSLAEAFFNPQLVFEGGLEPLIRGLAAQTQEATDSKIVGELRNQLFQAFIPGFGLVDGATDLASVNITRGRDHGLGFYNDVRAAYGLSTATDFSDITSDVGLQAALASVYSNVNEVDLWVGMLVEDQMAGASLSETTGTIISAQFTSIRDADRFWFGNDLGGINSDLMELAMWNGSSETSAYDWLTNLSLSKIMELNTGVSGLQENIFFSSAPVPEPAAPLLLLGALAGFALSRKRPGR